MDGGRDGGNNNGGNDDDVPTSQGLSECLSSPLID